MLWSHAARPKRTLICRRCSPEPLSALTPAVTGCGPVTPGPKPVASHFPPTGADTGTEALTQRRCVCVCVCVCECVSVCTNAFRHTVFLPFRLGNKVDLQQFNVHPSRAHLHVQKHTTEHGLILLLSTEDRKCRGKCYCKDYRGKIMCVCVCVCVCVCI